MIEEKKSDQSTAAESNPQPTQHETTNTAEPSETKPAENTSDESPQPAAAGSADPVVALQKENSDLKDKLLRTMAEMENLRRRTEREKTDTSKYAISNFAREILPIGDNIRRAIEAVPDGAIESDPALKTLAEGVQMTERELFNIMERHGIQRIDPEGETFDPNCHQAMFEIPNPDVTAGTVVEVIQAGFMIGDRVLRPALVGVSKGGAKVVKPQTAANQSEPPGQQRADQTRETSKPAAQQEAKPGSQTQPTPSQQPQNANTGAVNTGASTAEGNQVDDSGPVGSHVDKSA